MGREGRLVLAAENRSSVARKPAKYDISCINYIPLTRNVVRGRSKGTHGKLAFVLDYFFIRSAPQAAEAEGKATRPSREGQNQWEAEAYILKPLGPKCRLRAKSPAAMSGSLLSTPCHRRVNLGTPFCSIRIGKLACPEQFSIKS